MNDSVIFSALMGGILFILYLYLIYKKYYKVHSFLFAVSTFILLAAAITSISRSQFGLETAIASRYRLYSAVLLICYYFYFINNVNLSKNVKQITVLAFSGFYFINVSAKQIEYLDYRQHLNYLGAINYYSGNYKMLNGFEQDAYKVILEDSKNFKTYSLPDQEKLNLYYPFSNQVPNLSGTNNTDKWFTQGVEQIYELNDSFLIFGKGFLDGQSTFDQQIYLELEDGTTKKLMVFKTTKLKRYDMNPYFKKDNLEYGGFCCRIRKSLLGNNKYNIKLAISNNNLFKKELTDKKLKITY